MEVSALPLLVGAVATVVATAVGVLPERIDLTVVFSAYGAGAILGEAVVVRRPGLDPAVFARRWGGWLMFLVACGWVAAVATGELR